MSDSITQYGAGPNGSRAVGVEIADGLHVLVTPRSEELNERAMDTARRVVDQATADCAARSTILDLQNTNASLSQQLLRAQTQIAELERINQAAIAGRRRFFGPVLMRPEKPADWSGPVWLMDPEKQERGQCLPFNSVAEVHAMHPELWVVKADADGVLLDAWGSR